MNCQSIEEDENLQPRTIPFPVPLSLHVLKLMIIASTMLSV